MVNSCGTRNTVLATLGLAVLLAASGCGGAQADTLDVTYYYLPG